MATAEPADDSAVRSICNPLIDAAQVADCLDRLEGVPPRLRASVSFAAARLTQAAGLLLRLPQEVIAHAIILADRFWWTPNGQDMLSVAAQDISSASLYLAAKSSFHPRSARQIVNVYHYLTSPAASPLDFVNPRGYRQARLEEPNPDSYVLSDGGLDRAKNQLYELESLLLAGLGFDTRVALPYAIAMTYLQTLGFRERANNQLGARVVAHLNAALLSPQLLYLTHQPNALAVAAIYLAARELEVKLVAGNWWEVFDVTREDLGFLVLAMNSMQGFAREEHETWAGQGRPVPLTADDLRRYIQHNSSSDQG